MPELFTFSFIGSVFFGIALVLIHILRRDLSVAKSPLSRYALGRYDWIITFAMYAVGAAQIALAYALMSEGTVLFGHVLLMCAGTGALIAAAFEMEMPRTTIRGYTHTLGAGIEFALFPAALLTLAHSFAGTELYGMTLLIGWMSIFLFLANMPAYLYKKQETRYFGLIQKTNILVMDVWIVLVSATFM